MGSGHLLARLHKKRQRSGSSRQKNTALSSAYLASGVAKPLLEGFQEQTWIRHTHTHTRVRRMGDIMPAVAGRIRAPLEH